MYKVSLLDEGLVLIAATSDPVKPNSVHQTNQNRMRFPATGHRTPGNPTLYLVMFDELTVTLTRTMTGSMTCTMTGSITNKVTGPVRGTMTGTVTRLLTGTLTVPIRLVK